MKKINKKLDELCKKSYCHDCLPFITHYIGE